MMRKMDMLWIGAKTRIHNFWEDFKTEEKGAAEIVAIILIIVVVIGAAVIFKEKIMAIVKNVLGQAETFAEPTPAPSGIS